MAIQIKGTLWQKGTCDNRRPIKYWLHPKPRLTHQWTLATPQRHSFNTVVLVSQIRTRIEMELWTLREVLTICTVHILHIIGTVCIFYVCNFVDNILELWNCIKLLSLCSDREPVVSKGWNLVCFVNSCKPVLSHLVPWLLSEFQTTS